MKKIFLILLLIGFGLSLIKLNNNWDLEFNKGEKIKLFPGVYTKVPIQLTNPKILDSINNDETIYNLTLIPNNIYIITSSPEIILNPNENLYYTTYIGLKCMEIQPKPENNKIKYKIYYKNNNNKIFSLLGEFELNLEIKNEKTEIELEVMIEDMPGKSVNYFRLEEEIYNINEIKIEPSIEGLKNEGFEFKEIVIEPYLDREELYEDNPANHGILFNSPFWTTNEFSKEEDAKIYLSIKDISLNKCFKFDSDISFEKKRKDPVTIDEKVKTAVKFNSEDQTSQCEITNRLNIKTIIPVAPSIVICQFIPNNYENSLKGENIKYYRNVITEPTKINAIIDNLEENTEYYANCKLSNTYYVPEMRQNISLSIGNYDETDIKYQLMPSSDKNRIPQCAKFSFNKDISDLKLLELKVKGTLFCYHKMKKIEELKFLPTVICDAPEYNSKFMTFCVAPLPFYNSGKFLTEKDKNNFNNAFNEFIRELKDYYKSKDYFINDKVEQIYDVEISQSSIKASYINETSNDDNKNEKLLNLKVLSLHTQPVECYYNDDLNQNCKFSLLKNSIILNKKEKQIIKVKITSPVHYKMYSLNFKCYNKLSNFKLRYKTTGVMSIFTYFNKDEESEHSPQSESESEEEINIDDDEDDRKEITIDCFDKKNLMNPRCLKDEHIPITDKLTSDMDQFHEIENQAQQYSKMIGSCKKQYFENLEKNLDDESKKENSDLLSLFKNLIEYAKILTYTDCSIYSSGTSNKEEDTIKNDVYVSCRQDKQLRLEKILQILNKKHIYNCSSLYNTIISSLGDNLEENLKYVLILINELSNNPESYKKGLSQVLLEATICLQEDFDNYWTKVEKQLTSKEEYLDSTISAIKKDVLYIILQTLTNLAKVIHYDEIDGYINSTKTKTGIILNETYIKIQKKIFECSKKLNEFGDELYSLSTSMFSKIETNKGINITLDNETKIISIPNKNIIIRLYSNYMIKKYNAKTLQILVFDSPLISIKSFEKEAKTSDSVNTFISIILYNERGEEIPIKSIKKEFRPQILYLKDKYKSLKKCFYYNEDKNELETDGISFDDNFEYNGKKYIKCVSKHLTAFTAGTYNFNANIQGWAVFLIVACILIALISVIIIFVIVKKRKSRISYKNINSELNKDNALLEE